MCGKWIETSNTVDYAIHLGDKPEHIGNCYLFSVLCTHKIGKAGSLSKQCKAGKSNYNWKPQIQWQ